MCGDFFQLPPIGNDKFCFESHVWDELLGTDGAIVLDKVFRQKDGPFLRILNSMRRGQVTNECRNILQQKVIETRISKQAATQASSTAKFRAASATANAHNGIQSCQTKTHQKHQKQTEQKEHAVIPTVLFPRNKECDNHNLAELEKLF